jgi:toxin CptA
MNSKSILIVQRQPSRRLAAILCAMHLVSFVLLWPLTISLWSKAALTALLIASLIHYLRQDALLTARRAVATFKLAEDGRCAATLCSGETVIGAVQGGTFAAPYLTVILYQPEGRFFSCSIAILPDGIDAETFRKLRVWLRWKVRERR